MIGTGARLYERAAVASAAFDSLWHVDQGRTFYAGPLPYCASHQHGAPVFLVGLYGRFKLRLGGGDWLSCRTAMVPAGGLHELDTGGDPVAVFYVEPHVAGAHAFAPLLASSREVNGALVGGGGEISFFRDLYEDRSSAKWAGLALNDIVSFSRRRAPKEIDPRISCAIEAMYERCGDLTPVAQIAGAAGLSASRFQHLFTGQTGVPFRRYRAWNRMRAAIREIVGGSNFTTAAHAAGFSDQAHFAHDFRKTFGAAATYSLSKVRSASSPGREKVHLPASRSLSSPMKGVTL